MAEYRVNTGLLNEAGEDTKLLAAELDRYAERISSVITGLPEGFEAVRRSLTVTNERIYDRAGQARKLNRTLYEVIEVYSQAERNAMDADHRNINTTGASRQVTALPKIRSSTGAVMFKNTVLPNWLQMAVLEYERAQK